MSSPLSPFKAVHLSPPPSWVSRSPSGSYWTWSRSPVSVPSIPPSLLFTSGPGRNSPPLPRRLHTWTWLHSPSSQFPQPPFSSPPSPLSFTPGPGWHNLGDASGKASVPGMHWHHGLIVQQAPEGEGAGLQWGKAAASGVYRHHSTGGGKEGEIAGYRVVNACLMCGYPPAPHSHTTNTPEPRT